MRWMEISASWPLTRLNAFGEKSSHAAVTANKLRSSMTKISFAKS